MSSTLTNLTAATTWSGTDLFYALVGGNSRKIAASSFWICDAANVLSDVNSTTAQTVRVYRTFTDSSNYERLALQSGSGYMELAAQTAGTGTDNLDIRLTSAGSGKVLVQTAEDASLVFTAEHTIANNSFHSVGNFFASAITSAGQAAITVGKNTSTGNAGALSFLYYGDNDPGNEMNFVIYGSSPAMSFKNSGAITFLLNQSMPAGGSTNARILLTTTASFGIYCGSGAPTVTAAGGSLYLRTDGSSSSTRLYVNNAGSTWVNVTTAS